MGRGTNDNTIIKKIVNEKTGEERTVTLHRDHEKPTNRRQFLSTGLLGFSGMIVAPSILNVLARPEFAFGADNGQCVVSGSSMPAFITVNLAGGASLSSNLPPLGQNREPLDKYDILGLGPNQDVHTNTTKTLGTDIFQGVRVSGNQTNAIPAGFFWLGLSLRTSKDTRDKTSLINICVASNDDSGSNMADASGMVLAAGLSGQLLPNLGTSNSPTGVRQMPGGNVKPTAPLVVGNYTDIEGALKPAGTLATRLTESRRKKLLSLVNSLSGSQARQVASAGSASGTVLAKLVECATGKNIELSSKTDPGIDPGLDQGVRGVWGIDPGNKNGAMYAQAAMVYNALKGNSSACGIDLGGFDYHNNGRPNQNADDQRAGEVVGRILETAATMSPPRPVMIHIVSDGSVSASKDSAFGDGFTNDSGSRGMSYIIAFNPVARPKIKADGFKHQIGFFTPGQGASDQSVVGTPTKAAVAVFANYLAFAGQSSKLNGIAPGIFKPVDLDEVVRIVGS